MHANGMNQMTRRHALLILLGLAAAGLLVLFATGRVVAPRVLYLAPDENGIHQLFQVDPAGEAAGRPLVTADGGIRAFAPSPDGRAIALILPDPDGTDRLALFDLAASRLAPLADCGVKHCAQPAWTADGTRVLYDRVPVDERERGDGEMWWVDVASGESVPLFDQGQLAGRAPAISPDGRWIAFIVPEEEAVRLYHIGSGEIISLRGQGSEPPLWGADGALLYTNYQFFNEALLVHLYAFQPAGRTFTDLSGAEAFVADGSAEWSPESGWLVFTRRPARASLGGQLWVMRPDGSDARALTNNADLHHGAPAWSPDGRQIVYQRFAMTISQAEPEIWLYDFQTGAQKRLAAPGFLPDWLP